MENSIFPRLKSLNSSKLSLVFLRSSNKVIPSNIRKKTFIFGLVLGIILVYLTLRGVNLSDVPIILKGVYFLPIFFGLLLVIIGLILKAWRWKILLDASLAYSAVFAAITIGYLVNNILPARLGELARIYLIGRRQKVGISKTIGSIFVEKILDTLILVLTLIFLFFQFPQIKNTILFLGITLPKKWEIRVNSFKSSFSIFKDKRRLFLLLSISILIWVLEALWNFSIMKALNINLPISAAFLLAAVVNLGLFIPSPPGYIGVFHFITTFLLLSLGVEKSTALSYAILQNALEYLLLSALGIWSAVKISFDPFSNKWQNI